MGTATFEGRMSVADCMARCNAEDSCTAFDTDHNLSCFLHQTDVPVPVEAYLVECFIKQRNICCEAYTLSCQACAENMTEEQYCAICPKNGSTWENMHLCSELNSTTTTSMPGTESSSSSLALFLTVLMVFSFQF